MSTPRNKEIGVVRGEERRIPEEQGLVPPFFSSFWIADALKNLNFVVANAQRINMKWKQMCIAF